MRVWLFVLDCLLQRFLLLHPQLPTAVQKSPQVSSGQKIKPAYKNTFRNFKFTYLIRHMCSSIWEDSPNTNLFIVCDFLCFDSNILCKLQNTNCKMLIITPWKFFVSLLFLKFLYEIWHAEYKNHITFCMPLLVLMKTKKYFDNLQVNTS